MLDFNHRPDFGEALGIMIDESIVAHEESQPDRDYLGGSLIGRECAREIQFMYYGTPPDPGRGFDARIYRIFNLGHEFENLLFKYLRSIGFVILTHNEDESQIGFKQLGGRFRGHCDGIIIDGPAMIGKKQLRYPMLLEIKTSNDNNYKKYTRFAVKKSKPVYYAQMSLYLAYMDEFYPGISDGGALFTAVNKNDSEQYFEHVPFDIQNAQVMSDRAVHILDACDAGEPLPRIAGNRDHFECLRCDYQDRCWKMER